MAVRFELQYPEEINPYLEELREKVAQQYSDLEKAPDGYEWYLDVGTSMDPATWRANAQISAVWRLRRTPNRVSRSEETGGTIPS